MQWELQIHISQIIKYSSNESRFYWKQIYMKLYDALIIGIGVFKGFVILFNQIKKNVRALVSHSSAFSNNTNTFLA